LGKIKTKFGKKLLDLSNLIRFGQNQNLASPKTSDFLRLWLFFKGTILNLFLYLWFCKWLLIGQLNKEVLLISIKQKSLLLEMPAINYVFNCFGSLLFVEN